MHVGIVIPYFPPAWQYGGTPRAAFNLARALVDRGHAIRVLTTDSGGLSRLPSGSASQWRGIEVHYYRNISNHLAYRHRLFLPPAFYTQIEKQLSGCDVLHIHEFRSTLTPRAVRAAHRISL